ncbi:hypothetical protein [Streptomyces sp. NPDC048650]|uniref:hypothetical protein n=1 Tax=unclassified Streptomyces TaxID=2593676 RepID=UPI0037217475
MMVGAAVPASTLLRGVRTAGGADMGANGAGTASSGAGTGTAGGSVPAAPEGVS